MGASAPNLTDDLEQCSVLFAIRIWAYLDGPRILYLRVGSNFSHCVCCRSYTLTYHRGLRIKKDLKCSAISS